MKKKATAEDANSMVFIVALYQSHKITKRIQFKIDVTTSHFYEIT